MFTFTKYRPYSLASLKSGQLSRLHYDVNRTRNIFSRRWPKETFKENNKMGLREGKNKRVESLLCPTQSVDVLFHGCIIPFIRMRCIPRISQWNLQNQTVVINYKNDRQKIEHFLEKVCIGLLYYCSLMP